MYENLTKYLAKFSNNEGGESNRFGTQVIDNENDGTPEHPIQAPYVVYSSDVRNFTHDFYSFVRNHNELDLNDYSDILEENGIDLSEEPMTNAKVKNMDARCVLALLLSVIRKERFCEGALLESFECGAMQQWLERLKELDEDAKCVDDF